jgi:hypothetical protein
MDNQTNKEINNNNSDGTVRFSKGYNYSFEENGHVIHLHCSAVNGREKLYVDNKLASKKWSFRRKSLHIFSIENDSYEVELHVVDILKGETHCTLIKNGVHVQTLKQALTKSRQLDKDKLWWSIPLIFIVGVIAGVSMVEIAFMLFGE